MSETANTQAETGKKGKMSARELTTLGLLTGVLLLMSVTPLGYFHTFGLDISLMMVPVAIGAMLMGPKAGAWLGLIFGAMLMGPKAGAWLGLIFGATSFYQAVTGSSAFSTMLFNINPIYAFLLCIPTRVLMGFLTGVIFKAAQKVDKKKTVCYFVGGFFAAFLNTLFFMGVLLICYWNTEFIQGINETLGGLNPLMFVVAFVGVNGALEMPSSCIVGGIVSKAVNRALYTKKEA